MSESFVNTFNRGYVARMDLSDARTLLAQLPAAFEHFNEVYPHSSLKMRFLGSSGGNRPQGRAGALLRIRRGREYGANATSV